MTILEKLRKVASHFKEHGFSQEVVESENLIAHVLDLEWSELQLKRNQEFPAEKVGELQEKLDRRLMGEPLAYIQGYQDFYKNRFLVTPGVLIPRPETERLVDRAVELAADRRLKIIDIGCGSGCIGLSIAKEKPLCEVYLIDGSSKALEVTQKNSEYMGIKNVQFLHKKIMGKDTQVNELSFLVDMVVANPPYILLGDQRVEKSVHEFEPHEALYATDKGLSWVHSWLDWSYDTLKPEGWGLFEFGQGQTKDVVEAVKTRGFFVEEILKDFSQEDRVIIFRKG